jgi:hypothetical protein
MNYTCIYRLRTLTDSPPKHRKTHTTLKQTILRAWPEHGGTIPAQYRIHMSSREGMAQNDKAWCTLASARFPSVLQWFLVITLSGSCVLHGVLGLNATFTAHVDAQDVPFLIVFGCTMIY